MGFADAETIPLHIGVELPLDERTKRLVDKKQGREYDGDNEDDADGKPTQYSHLY